jgi:hypothetical protein
MDHNSEGAYKSSQKNINSYANRMLEKRRPNTEPQTKPCTPSYNKFPFLNSKSYFEVLEQEDGTQDGALKHQAINHQRGLETSNSPQNEQKNLEKDSTKAKNTGLNGLDSFCVHLLPQGHKNKAKIGPESDGVNILLLGQDDGAAHYMYRYMQEKMNNINPITMLNISFNIIFNELDYCPETIRPKLEPNVVALAFHVTDFRSFKRLTNELEHVKRLYPNSETLLIAVESSSTKGISYEEGEQWAFSNGMMFLSHNESQTTTAVLCKFKEAYDKNRA